MPGIGRYLKQTVALRRSAGLNAYGEAEHSDPVSVRARKVSAFGRTVNDLGVEIPNRTTLLVDTEVSVGDLIDGAAVEGVEEVRKKNGKLSHYEVQL